MKKRTTTAGGKAVKAQAHALLPRRPPAPKTIGTYGLVSKDAEVTRRTRTTKFLRLRVCAKVPRRPVDFLAIFVAGATSIVIIINAVFWQSGAKINKREQLLSKLQKTHESLKSEGERLQHKIDSASSRN